MNITSASEVIKSEAHNIAVSHLEEKLTTLNQLIAAKRDDEDEINQGQIDADTLSHNTEDQDNIMVMQQQVIALKRQLDLINTYKSSKPTSVVDPGSLVMVKDQAFYVSTSVKSFDYQGQKVTCLSVESPIYQEMRGLSAGDDFSCNGKNYHILKIA
jgi:transcription elongation GreA/GreB family factor